jgi:hypothetical protein
MTNRTRLERAERILGNPPCATCRDWPPDLDAFFLYDDDPWRRNGDVYDRSCPSCGRKPPVTRPWSDFVGPDLTEVVD